MKKMIMLIMCLLLCAGLAATAMADSWVCPECGSTNTGNFCGNDRQPRPVQADSWVCPECGSTNTGNFCGNDRHQRPTEATAQPPVYADAKSFIDDMPKIQEYRFENGRLSVRFDKAPWNKRIVQVNYFADDSESEQWSDVCECNGIDRLFEFAIPDDWTTNGEMKIYIGVPLHLIDDVFYDTTYDAILQFEEFDEEFDVYRCVYSQSSGKSGMRLEETDMVGGSYRETIGNLDLYGDGTCRECDFYHCNDDGSKDYIYVKEGGLVSKVSVGAVNKYLELDNGDDLTYYQNYADEHNPTWKNGGKLW